MTRTAAYWRTRLQLEPHPEGGSFREVYRSHEVLPQTALPDRFSGDRAVATSIYFMLEETQVSVFHRIQQDESWHHYDGCDIRLHLISPAGEYQQIYLGKTDKDQAVPQCTIPAGQWFAAELMETGSYALIGCTVAPGFDFADFEFGRVEDLLSCCPNQADVIHRLCKE